jgi:DNA-binding response OmpR family regulator
MGRINVLIADDEREIRELLHKYMERELYQVDTAADGEEALRLFAAKTYSLVILDLMMPGVDGIEVCRRLRSESNVPILMLTAKDQEVEKILGLSIGADDYMTKPFSIHEVVAKAKALLRRYTVLGSESGRPEDKQLIYKGIRIDPGTHTVLAAGDETDLTAIDLTAKEFELLYYMASHPNRVFTKTQLFRQVWDSQFIEDDNTVMVHIRKLRKKIEPDPANPQFIRTVWGIGYKFTGDKE